MEATRFAGTTPNKSRACMDFGGGFNVKETTACLCFRREGEEPRDSRWSMEGKGRSGRGVGLFLVMLLLTPLFAAVQAQSGGVVFDEASFSIDEYTAFEGENLPFTVEVHELSGFASNASLHLLVETLEGLVLSNTSLSLADSKRLRCETSREYSRVFRLVLARFRFPLTAISAPTPAPTNPSSHAPCNGFGRLLSPLAAYRVFSQTRWTTAANLPATSPSTTATASRYPCPSSTTAT